MNLDEHIQLWNIASIKVLDVRHSRIRQGDELRLYCLPASCFLCSMRGGAQIVLDGEKYVPEGFHVLHGGKGLSLDILPTGGEFEYYMIFYNGKIPVPSRMEIVSMLERNRPFHIHYGFAPQHPISLINKIAEMDQGWRQPGSLGRFQVKVSFYQFVHQLLSQLQVQGVSTHKPELVDQAVSYIHEYYATPVTLESLSEGLSYSASHLSIQFKRKMGLSPIAYLIQVRMTKATQLLWTTDAALHEIAASVGYADVNYFSRLFRKEKGMSPGKFRSSATVGMTVKDNAVVSKRLSIVSRRQRRYIDNDNRYLYLREGKSVMYNKAKFSTVAILLVCLTLLMGACSTGTSNSNNGASLVSPTQVPVSTAVAAEAESRTKVVTTVLGDVEIPMEPKKIVSVGLEDMLLSLEAPLVQAGATEGDYLYDTLQDKNIPVIYSPATPNYEAILAAEPDLIFIINGYVDQAGYEKLSQIAPTLAYERDDWRTSIVEIAKAINREEKANEIIQAYDDKLKQARETISQAVGTDKTVALLRPSEKEVDLFFPTFAYGGVLYNELGLKASSSVAGFQEKTEEDWGFTLSMEMLPELNPDYLFVTAGYSGSVESDFQKQVEAAKQVEQLQVWQAIPAVKQGQVHYVSARHWMLSGPISDSMKIDDVVQALTGNAKE